MMFSSVSNHAIATAFCVFVAVPLAGCGECATMVLERAESQYEQRDAVLVQRECGVVSRGSMGVSVVRRGERPDADSPEAGNVFEFTSPLKSAADTVRPIRRPTISWAAVDRLEITYDPRVRILNRVDVNRGLTIKYRTY